MILQPESQPPPTIGQSNTLLALGYALVTVSAFFPALRRRPPSTHDKSPKDS